MDRIDIVMDAILALVPNAKFNIYGDFSGLQWLDSRDAPTEAEVQSKYDELIADEPTKFLREVRDVKLAETDWTQSPDSPLSDSDKTAWATYRQSLRDITDTATSLEDVTWPTKP